MHLQRGGKTGRYGLGDRTKDTYFLMILQTFLHFFQGFYKKEIRFAQKYALTIISGTSEG